MRDSPWGKYYQVGSSSQRGQSLPQCLRNPSSYDTTSCGERRWSVGLLISTLFKAKEEESYHTREQMNKGKKLGKAISSYKNGVAEPEGVSKLSRTGTLLGFYSNRCGV